jgi:predicted SAM-dependent methyltransferase
MRLIGHLYKPIRRVLACVKLKKIIAHQLDLSMQLKIVVGAGGIYQPGWIPTDIDTLDLLSPVNWMFNFSRDTIDAVLAEHVWEHLTEKEGIKAAKYSYKYLKRKGYVRVAVPDGFHPNPEYLNWVKPGGSGDGAKDHKVLYNFRSLEMVFKLAGFNIDFVEYFDEKGEFHYKSWSPQDGMIYRSKRFDERNQNGSLNYTSLILDAKKE